MQFPYYEIQGEEKKKKQKRWDGTANEVKREVEVLYINGQAKNIHQDDQRWSNVINPDDNIELAIVHWI